MTDCQVVLHISDLSWWAMVVFVFKAVSAGLVGLGLLAIPLMIIDAVVDRLF